MSRVTIGDITEDLLPFTEKGNKVIMVEIVPRKIVEEIIHFCEANRVNPSSSSTPSLYRIGYDDGLARVKERAEYLLNEFEKEPEIEKPTNCRNCKYFNTIDEEHCLYSCVLKGIDVFGFERCNSWEERGKG